MEKMSMKAAFCLFVIVVAMGNEAMAEMKVCNMSEPDLMACKPAVSGLRPNLPSKACCSGLAHADMACLCSFYKREDYMELFGINPNLAMQLPQKCNLPTPTC